MKTTRTLSRSVSPTPLWSAGGGGCAVTLVPDDFADDALQALISTLEAQGYRPYVTAVGGSGMGILSPYDPIMVDGEDDVSPPLSPPATPDPNGAGESQHPSIRRRFESVDVSELSQWASGRGKWLYV
ncbi:hypothetical protein ONZ51_g13311 [Trametes cubensis]|uniref:Uncharacterized protein n=1 Tax=Trametes cubensis TaxID=1111947 RepID=A0AAD7TEB3_9APHY|nr:hypothetical protein ONZ51_g13311 [Trametes cubensis]